MALLLIALLSGSFCVASAQDQGRLNDSVAANFDVEEDLRNAVKVMLRFREYPDLSSEYRINSDNTVSVPVLGRLSIAGKSAADFEKELADHATQISGVASSVTVEIAEYKPLYVTGFVNRAGAVQWQPGMSVLQAVAVAGGLYRPRDQTTAAEDILPKLVDAQNRRLATSARLIAEKDGAGTIEPPKGVTQAVTKLLVQEAAVMASRRIALAEQLKVMEKGRGLSERELQGLRTQAAQIAAQLKVRREDASRYDELRKNGLQLVDKVLEHEVRILDLEEKLTNISVAVARVENAIVTSERDSAALQQAFTASLDAELVQVSREIAQADFDIDAARKLSGRQPASDRGDVITYGITRGPPRSRQRSEVAETSSVLPGDIVEVGTRPAGATFSPDISSPVADSFK